MTPKPPRGISLDAKGNIVGRSSKTGPHIEKHLHQKAALYAGLLKYLEEAREILGFTPNVQDKTVLMKVSQFWWKRTYAHVPGDGEALEKYMEFLADQPAVFKATSAVEPDALVNTMGARWCDQGFPVVTMGEKYFAALAATEVPPDMLEEVEAPWKCFMIEVPLGALTMWDPDEDDPVRITRLLVQRHFAPQTVLPHEPVPEPNWQWRWLAFSETNQHIWRGGLARQITTPVTFREQELANYYDPEREIAFIDQIAHDERLYVALGRIAINVCLALSDPENVKEVGSSHARYKSSSNRDPRTGPPEQRVYQLGKPIKVDCRPAVREWLGGTRESSTVNVQFLVRGHWRNQPHGPKHSLRRRQWIEPFWKGPEGGLLPLRPHVIEGGEG